MIVAELKIAIDEQGRVSVSGPIDNMLQCYGLLEVAKDVIRQRAYDKAKAVTAPTAADLLAIGAHK